MIKFWAYVSIFPSWQTSDFRDILLYQFSNSHKIGPSLLSVCNSFMICKTKIYLFPPVLCIVMKLPEFNKSDTIWIVDISEMQCLWKTFQRQPWSLKKYLYVNYFWSNSKSIAWICNQLNVELDVYCMVWINDILSNKAKLHNQCHIGMKKVH